MKQPKPKKVYVLMISRIFPAYHPRKGEETNFPEYIVDGKKEHTMRGNYKLWKYRADMINAGKAVLSIRTWTGKPYFSKQNEFCELSSITVQKAHIYQIPMLIGSHEYESKSKHSLIFIENSVTPLRHPFKFAYRDGLSLPDLQAWFKKPAEDMALIHFGNFKY